MTPPIALSCGEPSGIGPEIAAKAWEELRDQCPFVWIGDPAHLPSETPWTAVEDTAIAPATSAASMPVLPIRFPEKNALGTPSAANAASVIQSIETAVSLVKSGKASAVCTAPIHKKALIDGADFDYPGHTEFLAALAARDRVVMMLASDQLRVVPTTIHIPLSQVPQTLTPDLLRETIQITAQGLRDQFGITHPRIAVAGLNPHSGEGGKMGREEVEWITPFLTGLQSDDFTITGPHPADTMFHAAARKRYDVAIAMYHDQALIPIKTLDFDRGVNVTLGLPFIRTSPDHGTALDIAGKGIANPTSLIEALKMAQNMAQRSKSVSR